MIPIMGLELAATGYHKKKLEEFKRIQQEEADAAMAGLASGRKSLDELAQNETYLGGMVRLWDAQLKGATNKNLRMLFRLLRNSVESNLEPDKVNTVLSIAADLSEEEVWLLARLWKLYEDTGKTFRDVPISVDLETRLFDEGYPKEIFKARMARLERTGFIISEPLVMGGITYNPSPLLEQFVKLAELQVHDNIKL